MERWSYLGKWGRIGLLMGLFLLLGLFVLGCLGGGSKEASTGTQSPSGAPTATPAGGAPGGSTEGSAATPAGGPSGGPVGGMGGGMATQGPSTEAPPPVTVAEAPLPGFQPPVQKVPKDPVELAVLLKSKGKMDFAAASARKGVKRNPQSARAHYVLAWILVHVGKKTDAISEFNKALQLKLGGKDRQEAEGALQRLKGGGVPPASTAAGPGGIAGASR